jgi:hypothetical protein
MLSRTSAVKREITFGFSVRMNICEKDKEPALSFKQLRLAKSGQTVGALQLINGKVRSALDARKENTVSLF